MTMPNWTEAHEAATHWDKEAGVFCNERGWWYGDIDGDGGFSEDVTQSGWGTDRFIGRPTTNVATTMTDHKNIYMALAAAQGDMGKVVKGATNPQFKSKYANLSDVMQVVIPALNSHGVAPWHSIVVVNETNYMRTTLSHGSTETHINCDVPLLVSKADMQGMKSATTYAKRIGIESLTGIAPDDDDGNDAAKSAVDGQAEQERKDAEASAKEEAKQEALRDAVKALSGSIQVIKQGIAEDDLSTASEAWFELTNDEKTSIWVAPSKGGPFSTKERTTMQSAEFRLAREGNSDE